MTTFNTMYQEADELIYRHAFAGQSKDKETGEITVEDEDITYLSLDLKVKALRSLAKEVVFYISPSDKLSNFRYTKAVTPTAKGVGYKAGRPTKPALYQRVRDYFVTYCNAVEMVGYEADDGLSMQYDVDEGVNQDIILSHVDKDINMVPGWHYNHNTEDLYYIREGLGELVWEGTGDKRTLRKGGLKWFYAQMLMGDNIDNIPGIRNVGQVKAFTLLNKLASEEDCIKAVYNLYVKQYSISKAKDVFLEVADLLWMVRADKLTGSQYIQSKGIIL